MSGRGRGLVIAAGVVGLGLAGALVLRGRHGARPPEPSAGEDARAAVDHAFAAAEHCLIGGPLRKGDSAAARLRLVQLGALASPWASRAQPLEQRWPARCAPYLDRLATAADAPAFRAQPGAGELRAAAVAAADDARRGEVTARIADLWAAAARAGVRPDDPGEVPMPPPAAHPLAREDLQSLAPGAGPLDVLASDPQPSRALHLIVAPPDRATALYRVCTFAPSPDALAEARCVPLGAGVPSGPRVEPVLLATDDEATGLYAGTRPAGPVFAILGGVSAFYPLAGGPPVEAPGMAAAFAARDGTLTVLQTTERGYALLHGTPPSLGTPRALPVRPNAVRRAALAWGQPVWIEQTADGDVLRALPANTNTNANTHESAPATVGPVPEPRLGIVACHSAAGTWVVTSGEPEDSAAFFDGAHWSAPVRTAGLFSLEGPALCHGDHVTRTRVRAEADRTLRVTHVDCSPAGCAQHESRVDLGPVRYAARHAVAAADLDGRVLLVWVAPAEMGGGVWLRLGAPDALDRTPGTVLLDGAAHGGVDATGVELFAREGAAVVLVHTPGGSYPVRVLPDGTFQAVAVRPTVR